MIGNDIIDLNLALKQSDWKRKGWLQKICTKHEQSYILNSEKPFLSVWRLWSMKESAYKAEQRIYQLAPKFNPKSFECNIVSGKIVSNKQTYHTQSTITKDYIHTYTYNSNQEIAIQKLDNSNTLIFLEKKLNIPKSRLSIKKDSNNIPHIYIDDKLSNNVISISHHGKYRAYNLLKI